MFYYLYEIRNNLNGKIYIGVHKTCDMNDGYMGSGKVIKAAIEKYGIENFTKIILETFDHGDDMYAREREIVTDEFLMRDDVYNLRRGGSGGFEFINNTNIPKFLGRKHTEESKQLMGHLGNDHAKGKNLGNCNNPKLRERGKEHPASHPKTPEHKEKLKIAALKNQHLYEDVTCPYCGKIGGKNAMRRYHFDKCKKRV